VRIKDTDSSYFLAAGSGDESGSIYEVTKSELQSVNEPVISTTFSHKLSGHTDSITSIGYSFNGQFLATGSMDGSVQIWNDQYELKHHLQGPTDAIEWIDWHNRGNVLVAGTSDGACWMWNAATGACMNVFSGHEAELTCGGFSPDGKAIVTGSRDQTVRVWNPTTGSAKVTFSGSLFHEAAILCLDLHPDSAIMVSGAEDGGLRVSNYATGKVLQRFEDHEDSVETVKFCPVLTGFISGSLDGLLKTWDMNTAQLRWSVLAHEAGVVKVLVRDHLLFSGGVDGALKVWDIRSGTCVRTLTGHTKAILDFDVSKDGKIIASSADDATVRVFEV